MKLSVQTYYILLITLLILGCDSEADQRTTSPGEKPVAAKAGASDSNEETDKEDEGDTTLPELDASELGDMQDWEVSLLERQNVYRQNVEIEDFQWSKKLAESAHAWADSLKEDGCKAEHSTTEYGESYSAFSTGEITTADHADRWGDERADYDYDTNTCGEGKECGHYIQLVWKDTKTVGCGYSKCEEEPFYDIVVCHYYPAADQSGKDKPY